MVVYSNLYRYLILCLASLDCFPLVLFLIRVLCRSCEEPSLLFYFPLLDNHLLRVTVRLVAGHAASHESVKTFAERIYFFKMAYNNSAETLSFRVLGKSFSILHQDKVSYCSEGVPRGM